MAKLPHLKSTKYLLDQRIISKDYGREYLGMSQLGEECTRKLWYNFHFATKRIIFARTDRIFNIGHLFEAVAIADLKAVGLEVYKYVDGEKVELTGAIDEDQETLLGFCGHESGHTDGRICGFPEFPNEEMNLELKTMKAEHFIAIKKKGLINSDTIYYEQVQKYMRESKVKKSFFMAVNKNTSEYYTEFVDYDSGTGDDLARKARDIILSDKPPPQAYPDGFFKCVYRCQNYKICHGDFEPEQNCRTCKFSTIDVGGKWMCENNAAKDFLSDGQCEDDYSLSVEEQKKGCMFYKKGWGL
jgi:hypothetical protein